jgi:hypothetical protein
VRLIEVDKQLTAAQDSAGGFGGLEALEAWRLGGLEAWRLGDLET